MAALIEIEIEVKIFQVFFVQSHKQKDQNGNRNSRSARKMGTN